MAPNISDSQVWHQANLLMQPILIRLIDHLRKALEEHHWRGEYVNQEIWPDSADSATRERRQALVQALETAEGEQTQALQGELDRLPSPYPGYVLKISAATDSPELDGSAQDPFASFDLWELCYHICFTNYPQSRDQGESAMVDPQLIDEMGDVEWNQVDEKTQHFVAALLAEFSSD